MRFTRRAFVQGGVAAFTFGLAAPSFLSDIARAQNARGRNLVVLFLDGGNDALSTLVPYNDPAYYNRRPNEAVPASRVLHVGTDSAGIAHGLHPNLAGLKSIFDAGRLAIIQRTGYPDSSRSHFLGTDVVSTATPDGLGAGWLGRYLETLPSPVDPLFAWNTAWRLPRALRSPRVGVPSIVDPRYYAFQSPVRGREAEWSRPAMESITGHVRRGDHLAFVNATSADALATLDRVATVAAYTPTVPYPETYFGRALEAVAGALATEVGTQIFFVQLWGFDTHAAQSTNTPPSDGVVNLNGLLTTLDEGLSAFYADLSNQRLFDQTLVLQFSEFGRRVSENGSAGTDHGAGGLMMALGGRVRGGLYGTGADLEHYPSNPTLENEGGDVRHETDFRSVYARVIDHWLGASSVDILGGDFRSPEIDIDFV